MKEKKRKKIICLIFLGIALFILGYDTYQLHFANHKRIGAEHLSVEYENAGNLLLSNIQSGNSTSLRVHIKNETDRVIRYQISFEDVQNDLNLPNEIVYTFSKDSGQVEIQSGVFPTKDITLLEGDEVEPNEDVDYILTVRVRNLDASDFGKNIQARIKIIENDFV